MFKAIYGLCTELTCGIERDDTVLKLKGGAGERVCRALGADDFTYLLLSDGVDYEFVKASCEKGALVVSRGQDGTAARAWSACTSVKFDWSPTAMTVAAQQANNALASSTDFVCRIVSDSLTVSDANTDGCDCHESCAVRVEAPAREKVGPLQVGNQLVTFNEDGSVSVEPAPAGTFPADGVYENATVTVRDGQVVGVKTGTNIIKSSCGSCCGG